MASVPTSEYCYEISPSIANSPLPSVAFAAWLVNHPILGPYIAKARLNPSPWKEIGYPPLLQHETKPAQSRACILDVAGGAGALAMSLQVGYGLEAVVIDPRKADVCKRLRHMLDATTLPPGYAVGRVSLATKTASEGERDSNSVNNTSMSRNGVSCDHNEEEEGGSKGNDGWKSVVAFPFADLGLARAWIKSISPSMKRLPSSLVQDFAIHNPSLYENPQGRVAQSRWRHYLVSSCYRPAFGIRIACQSCGKEIPEHILRHMVGDHSESDRKNSFGEQNELENRGNNWFEDTVEDGDSDDAPGLEGLGSALELACEAVEDEALGRAREKVKRVQLSKLKEEERDKEEKKAKEREMLRQCACAWVSSTEKELSMGDQSSCMNEKPLSKHPYISKLRHLVLGRRWMRMLGPWQYGPNSNPKNMDVNTKIERRESSEVKDSNAKVTRHINGNDANQGIGRATAELEQTYPIPSAKLFTSSPCIAVECLSERIRFPISSITRSTYAGLVGNTGGRASAMAVLQTIAAKRQEKYMVPQTPDQRRSDEAGGVVTVSMPSSPSNVDRSNSLHRMESQIGSNEACPVPSSLLPSMLKALCGREPIYPEQHMTTYGCDPDTWYNAVLRVVDETALYFSSLQAQSADQVSSCSTPWVPKRDGVSQCFPFDDVSTPVSPLQDASRHDLTHKGPSIERCEQEKREADYEQRIGQRIENDLLRSEWDDFMEWAKDDVWGAVLASKEVRDCEATDLMVKSSTQTSMEIPNIKRDKESGSMCLCDTCVDARRLWLSTRLYLKRGCFALGYVENDQWIYKDVQTGALSLQEVDVCSPLLLRLSRCAKWLAEGIDVLVTITQNRCNHSFSTSTTMAICATCSSSLLQRAQTLLLQPSSSPLQRMSPRTIINNVSPHLSSLSSLPASTLSEEKVPTRSGPLIHPLCDTACWLYSRGRHRLFKLPTSIQACFPTPAAGLYPDPRRFPPSDDLSTLSLSSEPLTRLSKSDDIAVVDTILVMPKDPKTLARSDSSNSSPSALSRSSGDFLSRKRNASNIEVNALANSTELVSVEPTPATAIDNKAMLPILMKYYWSASQSLHAQIFRPTVLSHSGLSKSLNIPRLLSSDILPTNYSRASSKPLCLTSSLPPATSSALAKAISRACVMIGLHSDQATEPLVCNLCL